MFSSRTVILLFLFDVIAIIGSTNGEPGCDSSPSREELYDEQARKNLDNADRFGRITLDCETTGGGSVGHSGFETIIDLSVGLFFLLWVAIGIWIVFVQRQQALNAAAIKPYPGEVGANETGYGMDEKTKTVVINATSDKLSKGDTNV